MAQQRVSIKANKSEAQLDVLGVGWIPILLGSLMLLAIFVPYFITLYRGILNPFLPFISQAAGSPPQSGLFCIFLSLAASVGFFGMHLLYLGIKVIQTRLPAEKQSIVQFLSKLSLIPGHLSLLGMIVVGGYPIDFHRHEGDWIPVTVLPHLTGSITLFAGGVTYCCIVTVIMSIALPEKRKLLVLRIILLASTITSAIFHVLTVQHAFIMEYNDENRLRFCTVTALEYDRNYIICSLCEWTMVVTFIMFFMTIYDEAKNVSFTLLVTYTDDPVTDNKSPPSSKNTHLTTSQNSDRIKDSRTDEPDKEGKMKDDDQTVAKS